MGVKSSTESFTVAEKAAFISGRTPK